MEKKEKKGFWTSLFSSKPCKCSCRNEYVIPAGETSEVSADTTNRSGKEVKEIKVLGPGCAKCKSTFAVVEKAVKASGMSVELSKVEDIEEIMRYQILSTPAVVVDGKVVIKGRVPSESEIKQLLGI